MRLLWSRGGLIRSLRYPRWSRMITFEEVASPKLAPHLLSLFNGCIQHGYVPQEFLRGVIAPDIKDSSGDIWSAENYRRVTLLSTLSQLCEQCLLLKFSQHLLFIDLQFGFKKCHSTSHAVFVMKKCADYYVERGSLVFVTLNHHVFSKNDDISVIFIKKSKVTSCILLQHPGK